MASAAERQLDLPIVVSRLPEYKEESVGVSAWSTVRVKRNASSVPSRLIGETVRVRVHDQRLEIYHGDKLQLEVERLHGAGGHRINYRHIIWSLVQKPGAFARYRYREDLFPTLTFRRAYDRLSEGLQARQADVEYLRILHLAASTMESTVEAALEQALATNETLSVDAIKRAVAPEQIQVPDLDVPEVSLGSYDMLLSAKGMEVGA